MEYKDFISKLHIKGTWLPKDEFTKQLFESSVRDTSVITDKRNSINTFKGYNRGNPINEIAYDVINDSTNLKESGIEVFIEKYLNNAPDKKFEYAQKICDKFKDQIPDISRENICKKIAIFFIEKVLIPAAKEYKITLDNIKAKSNGKVNSNSSSSKSDIGRQFIEDEINVSSNDTDTGNNNPKSYTPNSSDNHYEDNSINIGNITNTKLEKTSVNSTTNHITNIDDDRRNTIVINIVQKNEGDLAAVKGLINELNSRFLDLDEKSGILHLSSWTRSEKQQNEKEQEFRTLQDIFIDANKKLRQYNLTFPKLNEIFEKMILLSETLTFRYDFRNDGDNRTFIKCDDQIEEYRKCIKEVWKALTYL